MSGGGPSSIKRFIGCAVGSPVRSRRGGYRRYMPLEGMGVWLCLSYGIWINAAAFAVRVLIFKGVKDVVL